MAITVVTFFYSWTASRARTRRGMIRQCLAVFTLSLAVTLVVYSAFGRDTGGRTDRQEQNLRKFLQHYVKDRSYDYRATKYFAVFARLTGTSMPQAIVYFTDQDSCGSGGCTMLILTPEDTSYKIVTSISIARLPIRVLVTESHGWHDIGVWVQGGGIQPGYEARLSFNGKSYPSNPTVPPARPVSKTVVGRIVIPLAAFDQAKPLYP